MYVCEVEACRTNCVVIVLMCAELNDFLRSDFFAERNDCPDSDIIEHRPYNNAQIFHMSFSNLKWITKGKVSERRVDSTVDLLKTEPKSELK